MKNETARREIESLDYYLQNHTDDYSEESHTAMMMAIKALEQQSCGDVISRQAVKELYYKDGYIDFRKICELPPVNPQPCEDAISRQAVLDIVDSYSESQSNVEDVTQDIISDIVALLPVNPQPCEDVISREDALMRLTGEIKETDTIETIIARFLRRIRKLPPVNPTKTGHWIKVTNGRGGHECDLCHEYAPSYQSGDEYLSKFCPNCGVKMGKEQE